MSDHQRVRNLIVDSGTAWTLGMIGDATGITDDNVRAIVSKLTQSGHIDRVSRGSYAAPGNPPAPRPAPVKPALPAGPCPQSDALLRLMRGAGGARTCRQWAAMWAERDSATQQMLNKLVDRGLIGHMNGAYRA